MCDIRHGKGLVDGEKEQKLFRVSCAASWLFYVRALEVPEENWIPEEMVLDCPQCGANSSFWKSRGGEVPILSEASSSVVGTY